MTTHPTTHMTTHPATRITSRLAVRARTTPAAVAGRMPSALRRRIRAMAGADAGMSTVEYAVGTIAAAAFGAVLYTVVSGDSIPDALGGIIEQALTTSV